jgi:MFS family permease
MGLVTSPYRTVLRTPGALRFAVSGFIGRFPMAMMPIAIVLVVRHRTGSYAIAGAASAAHTITSAAVTPLVGRLVDRFGQSAVIDWLVGIFLAGIAILTIATASRAPTAVLFAGAVIAGAGQPPFGSLVRARWTHLLSASQLATALAWESSADEVIYGIGPIVVTALAAWTTLAAPLLAAGLALAGTLLFLGARGSEPPPVAGEARTGAWRIHAMWVVIASSVLIGVVFGSVEVAVIAFAQRHGHSGLAGLLLGLIALGSLCAGLWYGSRQWQRDLNVRYRLSLATLAVGGLPAVAASTVWQLAPAALLVGVSIAPTLIAGSGLVARVVPASSRTEGFTWQVTGINVGAAGGATLGGVLIDAVSVRAAFLVGPVAAAIGAAVALGGARLLAPVAESAPSAETPAARAS